MKSVIITEEQLQNLDEIGKELFNDEQDPRSMSYIRKLNRPPISWIRIILCILIPAVVLAAIIVVLPLFEVSLTMAVVIAAIVFTVYVAFMLKRAVICAVKIYQRYAPESVRNKCRFEPSCSEYMILSIEKYGLIKGVCKGIGRLKRCNINGGGFDYP